MDYRSRKVVGAVTGVFAVAAALSCDRAGPTDPIELEARKQSAVLAYVSGNSQAAGPGSALPAPVIVRTVDARGNAVAGIPVEFVVKQGGGSVAPASVESGSDGIASAVWTLGPGGSQGLEAGIAGAKYVRGGSASTVAFTATLSGSPEVATVTVAPALDTVYVGGADITLTATARSVTGGTLTGLVTTWASSDTSVARVDGSGRVRGYAAGSATITATVDGINGTSRVRAVDMPLGKVSIGEVADTVLEIGTSVTLQASATSADGTPVGDAVIEWGSLNPEIATVDSMGNLLARTAGTVLIIASAAGCAQDTAGFVVEPPVDGAPQEVNDLAVAGAATNAVTLRWTAVSDGNGGVAKYAVRYGSPTLTWSTAYPTEQSVEADAVGEQVTFTYSGLADNTDYQFRLVPYRGTLDQDAVFGPPSNIAAASTDGTGTTPPPSPISVSASAIGGDGRVTLSASTPTGGTAPYTYQWHGGTSDPGTTPTSGTALSGMTSLTGTHTGLVNGTTYYYRLVVRDAAGASAVSGVATATPQAPASGTGDYPNLPSGLSVIGAFNGSVEESNGHAFGIADFGSWEMDPSAPESQIQVVQDPTNPTGSGYSLRFTWDQAYNPRSGNATANSFTGGPYRELYIMQRVYLESGFEGFGNKYFYVGIPDADGPTDTYSTREADGRVRFVTQNGASVILIDSSDPAPMGTNSTPLTRGTWLNIEYRFVAQSSASASDGQVYIWVNGRLAGYNTGVRWVSSGTLGFSGMEWYGDTNTVTSRSIYRLGELYIAGRR